MTLIKLNIKQIQKLLKSGSGGLQFGGSMKKPGEKGGDAANR
jgi:hypothetical protein